MEHGGAGLAWGLVRHLDYGKRSLVRVLELVREHIEEHFTLTDIRYEVLNVCEKDIRRALYLLVAGWCIGI